MSGDKQEESIETLAVLNSDAMTALNLSGVALGPAVAVGQTMFSQAQAQGMMYANNLAEQQNIFATSQAATIKVVAEIYGISKEAFHFPSDQLTTKD